MNEAARKNAAPAGQRVAELVRAGVVELREAALPEPGPGELLLRVEAALTCGTDIKAYQRGHPKIPFPSPLGHEVAGSIAALGAGVRGFREGDAVALVPTAPCGHCELCRRGRDNLCAAASGRLLLGAFADYVRIPEHIVACHVFPRPAALSAAEAAALEPLACVLHGAGRVALERAESAVFVGDGPIALLFAQLAKLRGVPRVVLIGKHTVRLAAARALGIDAVIDASTTPAAEAVRQEVGAQGAQVVIECVGRPEVWESAASLVAPGGELLLFGGCAAGTRARFDTYRIHYEEVDVKGAFHYGRAAVRDALTLLETGRMRVTPLITHERPLARLAEALELVITRQAIKVCIKP